MRRLYLQKEPFLIEESAHKPDTRSRDGLLFSAAAVRKCGHDLQPQPLNPNPSKRLTELNKISFKGYI